MSNTFQLPKPKLVREAKQRNQNHDVAFIGKRSTSKLRKARPVIPDHDCLSESNCDICRFFLNELDKRRMLS